MNNQVANRLAALRETHAEIVGSDGGESPLMQDLLWACDEIDHLRGALERIRERCDWEWAARVADEALAHTRSHA